MQKILDVRARTILQDVKVLASGKDFAFVSNPLSNKSEKGSGNATSVTLALTPRQAQQVILAQRISILSLMLRRHGEEEGEVEVPQDNVFSITGNQEVMFDKETPKFLEVRGGASSLSY
jgi:Flp pilus assembly protein CpaB